MFSRRVDDDFGADAGGVGRSATGCTGGMDGGDRRAGHVEPLCGDGHLIHGEVADWMPRLEMILKFGPCWTFALFDREAQF